MVSALKFVVVTTIICQLDYARYLLSSFWFDGKKKG